MSDCSSGTSRSANGLPRCAEGRCDRSTRIRAGRRHRAPKQLATVVGEFNRRGKNHAQGCIDCRYYGPGRGVSCRTFPRQGLYCARHQAPSSFNSARIDHIYKDPHDPDTRFQIYYGDMTDSTNQVDGRFCRTMAPPPARTAKRNPATRKYSPAVSRRTSVACSMRRKTTQAVRAQ